MFVAGFLVLPEMNFTEAEAVAEPSVRTTKKIIFKLKTGAHFDISCQRFSHEEKLGETYSLGSRAEHTSLCSIDAFAAIPAQCQFVEHLSDDSITYAALADRM